MFVVFEGIDGSGKSTVIGNIEKKILALGRLAHITSEPSSFNVGREIRTILKSGDNSNASHRIMALLFAADRLNHVESEILPAVQRDEIVLCDRYKFSSMAYQSVKNEMEWVESLNKFAVNPDLTIFLSVSVDNALKRIDSRLEKKEIFEKRDFLEKIDANYDFLIKKYGKEMKIVTLDGNESAGMVADKAWQVIKTNMGL